MRLPGFITDAAVPSPSSRSCIAATFGSTPAQPLAVEAQDRAVILAARSLYECQYLCAWVIGLQCQNCHDPACQRDCKAQYDACLSLCIASP